MKTSSNDVNQLSDVVFEQEVNQVRELISEPVKPDKLSSAANLSVSNAESIMEEVYSSAKSPRLSSSVFLLEVYAGKNSPLTDLAQKMNLRAIRFTRDDGDLSTPWGRKKLWEWIDKFQPEHIWVAPECGPWGGWSRLNQSKSVDLHDAISREQEKQLIHVRLCSQLCNFQIQNHRQFHLEQPLGSRMVFLPEFQPIFRQTLHAKFDMCVLGLKLPKTNRFLKKRSQVFSTHETLVIQLDNCQCSNAHEHHHIEGSVTVDQQRMPLTRFCATYCSGFVRFVLKALCIENALVNEDEPPQKKTRFSNSPAKRIRLNPIDEKDPEPIEGDTRESESPDVKAQSSDPNQVNMELKNPISDPAGSSAAVSSEPSSTSERWKEAFRMAHVIAPRVGNILVDDSSLLTGLVQSCISDMTVQKVFRTHLTTRFEVRGPRFEVRGPRSEVRGPRFEVRGARFEVRGPRYEVRGARSEVRGTRSEVRGTRSEVRGTRSEVRGPRYEVRGSRYEVRGPRFAVRGPRFEVRGPRFEVRGPRSEVRGTRSEVRGTRFVARGPRSEVRGPRCEVRRPTPNV